ncbi:DEAD/DEAH box helicase [Pseudoalteromonas denitrificans]|uniref:Superfamily II DNA and RNA helicase n=1 Tax=Pseudoalteromonas denitrificans DSM 6059 TaxID=1123010 RepID=A0A1I1GX36_9GAMM|nr:DEAD/DEAH box helicase [Pseudoalteromonas denitrificans]SFC16046.1 Superfamily II DNA and RNA helicase [Pseudoalteromonas denitrificans DSM 6059]
MNFKSFSFAPEILRAIDECGYQELSPIQRLAIPHVRKGHDVLANAQTGTGKTAAFALPILQKLIDNPKPRTTANARVLVLAPTRELAEQIANSFERYGQYTDVKVAAIFGGVDINTQAKKLKLGVDVIVATPGRLLDHINSCNVSISNVEFLVLDEADRMLDMGFINEINTLMSASRNDRQTMLFSATYPSEMKKFSTSILKNPKIVQASKDNATAETVQHVVYPVEQRKKQELLSELIGTKNWQQVLVFVNFKETADEIVKELNLDGIKAAVCHGDKTQGNRRRALKEFKEGKVRVLVATEVAARGIDIDGLERVVNIDLPWLAEDYVHRIGRTGRAGNSGQAVSFVSREEEQTLEEIETLIGSKIRRIYVPGYEVSNRDALVKRLHNKPNHQKRGGRTNNPNSQAAGEARIMNRKKISNVRKKAKGQKLKLAK